MKAGLESVQTILVMGVCGSGKSTLARLLAAALRAEFVEADAFHSAANIARMRAGIALTDADRAGWLGALNRALLANHTRGRSQVLACSALKETYRSQLAAGLPQMQIIFLDGPRHVLEARLSVRHQHFMPASLLGSQLEILERPGGALSALSACTGTPIAQPHGVLTLPLTLSPAQALSAALNWLHA